jgi:hypothetical protein
VTSYVHFEVAVVYLRTPRHSNGCVYSRRCMHVVGTAEDSYEITCVQSAFPSVIFFPSSLAACNRSSAPGKYTGTAFGKHRGSHCTVAAYPVPACKSMIICSVSPASSADRPLLPRLHVPGLCCARHLAVAASKVSGPMQVSGSARPRWTTRISPNTCAAKPYYILSLSYTDNTHQAHACWHEHY